MFVYTRGVVNSRVLASRSVFARLGLLFAIVAGCCVQTAYAQQRLALETIMASSPNFSVGSRVNCKARVDGIDRSSYYYAEIGSNRDEPIDVVVSVIDDSYLSFGIDIPKTTSVVGAQEMSLYREDAEGRPSLVGVAVVNIASPEIVIMDEERRIAGNGGLQQLRLAGAGFLGAEERSYKVGGIAIDNGIVLARPLGGDVLEIALRPSMVDQNKVRLEYEHYVRNTVEFNGAVQLVPKRIDIAVRVDYPPDGVARLEQRRYVLTSEIENEGTLEVKLTVPTALPAEGTIVEWVGSNGVTVIESVPGVVLASATDESSVSALLDLKKYSISSERKPKKGNVVRNQLRVRNSNTGTSHVAELQVVATPSEITVRELAKEIADYGEYRYVLSGSNLDYVDFVVRRNLVGSNFALPIIKSTNPGGEGELVMNLKGGVDNGEYIVFAKMQPLTEFKIGEFAVIPPRKNYDLDRFVGFENESVDLGIKDDIVVVLDGNKVPDQSGPQDVVIELEVVDGREGKIIERDTIRVKCGTETRDYKGIVRKAVVNASSYLESVKPYSRVVLKVRSPLSDQPRQTERTRTYHVGGDFWDKFDVLAAFPVSAALIVGDTKNRVAVVSAISIGVSLRTQWLVEKSDPGWIGFHAIPLMMFTSLSKDNIVTDDNGDEKLVEGATVRTITSGDLGTMVGFDLYPKIKGLGDVPLRFSFGMRWGTDEEKVGATTIPFFSVSLAPTFSFSDLLKKANP